MIISDGNYRKYLFSVVMLIAYKLDYGYIVDSCSLDLIVRDYRFKKEKHLNL